MGNEDVLATCLASHHGVVTRQWLREHLFTDGHVRGLRESGRLVEVHRGVYVATSSGRTQLQRMVALVAYSNGAISHASAGQLWGFRKLSRHSDIHMSVLKGARRRTEGSGLDHVVLHSTSDLPSADLVRRSDGIVYTSAARTVFDLSSMIPADLLESIIEQGLAKGLFTRTKLLATQARLARPGRNGAARFNTVLAQRPVTQRPVDSDYELRLVKALERDVDSRRFSARCLWNWLAVTLCTRIWPSRAVSSSSRWITRHGTAATSKAATTDGAIASTACSAGTRSG